jgi:hypothetical protein
VTWDIYAIRAPAGVRRLDDLPVGHEAPPIGTPDAVAELIRTVAPHADATDPRWLRLDGPDHSVEVFLGKDVQVRDVTFLVDGGDGAVGVIFEVCRRLGVTPYDTETGEALTASSRPPVAEPTDEADQADQSSGHERRRWWRRRGGDR